MRFNVLRDIGSLIFPGYCPSCGDECRNGPGWICETCWANLPKGRVGLWSKQKALKDLTTVAFSYSGSFRDLIHALKFYGRRDVAAYLGQKTVERVLGWNTVFTADAVVPVPLHKVRIRERGYDQNLVIATAVADGLSIPLDCRLIVRVRNTSPQARLSDEERVANIKGAFSIYPNLNKSVPESVLLVDDVIHTGSTAKGCIGVLREAGVKEIKTLACCG